MRLTYSAPPVADFIEMRALCGWGVLEDAQAQRALETSLIHVTCYDITGTVAGFGRIIGDGAVYFYLQDIIVRDDYRGQGYGALIVGALLDELRKIAPQGAFVGLMAAHGAEAFYEKFGFARRPDIQTGAGMGLRL